MPEFNPKLSRKNILEKFPKAETGEKGRIVGEKDDSDKVFQAPIVRFDPKEELAKIEEEFWKMTPAERSKVGKEKIADFKKKLMEQKEGLAEIQKQLEDIIIKHPDAGENFYYYFTKDMIKQYHLSEYQEEKFKQAIQKYTEKHQNIKNTLIFIKASIR